MINGTITDRGFGSSPDVITIVESNSSGNIVFRPPFPNGTLLLGVSYSVDIHVYEPVANTQVGFQFNTVQILTVNGNIQVSSINTSSLTLTDTNGDIEVSNISAGTTTALDSNGSIHLACVYPCGNVTMTTTNGNVSLDLSNVVYGGSYVMKTTNGNVDLKVPAGAASFKITPNTANGMVSASGLGSNSQITPQPRSEAELPM